MSSSRGSSQPRDRTHVSYVSCIGRWLLYHQHHLGSPNLSQPLKKNKLIFGCAGSSLRQVGATLQLWPLSFSLWQLLLLWSMASRAQAQQLWDRGLVDPRHVKSSWTRDQTHVPCIGGQILNHWATREVLLSSFFFKKPKCYPGSISEKILRNTQSERTTESL